ncbi:unnamed protein product, partial [Cyprideis torosa]
MNGKTQQFWEEPATWTLIAQPDWIIPYVKETDVYATLVSEYRTRNVLLFWEEPAQELLIAQPSQILCALAILVYATLSSKSKRHSALRIQSSPLLAQSNRMKNNMLEILLKLAGNKDPEEQAGLNPPVMSLTSDFRKFEDSDLGFGLL